MHPELKQEWDRKCNCKNPRGIVTRKTLTRMLSEALDQTTCDSRTTFKMEKRVHSSLRVGHFTNTLSKDILVSVVRGLGDISSVNPGAI